MNIVFYMMEKGGRISEILARNLSSLRKERGISLSGLAEKAGISKSTLSSLEAGEANPTISTLWALADALGVPFGVLVSERIGGSAEVGEAGVNVRLIEHSEGEPRIEVYLMRIEANCRREAAPHVPGVRERILVIDGRMLAGPLSSPSLVKAGEVFSFRGDEPHVYIALDKPATALVSVEYPKGEVRTDRYTILFPLPRGDAGWEGISVTLRRALEEVALGIPVLRVKLHSPEEPMPEAVDRLVQQLRKLQNPRFKLPIRFFIVMEEDGLSVFIFACPRGRVQLGLQPGGKGALGQAARVARLMFKNRLSEQEQRLLRGLVGGESPTLSALAAEILQHHGHPAVPPSVLRFLDVKGMNTGSDMKSRLFDHRVSCSPYKALHPAHALQSLTLAHLLNKTFEGASVSAVHVGTGPGLHLRMLLELYPPLKVVAVEPSAAACEYLRRSVVDGLEVNLIQSDFLRAEPGHRFPVVISVGASHHITTPFFLQKACELLHDGGLLLVADEFLSPYTTASERNRELIKHHSVCMLATLFDVPHGVRDKIAPEELELVDMLGREVPLLAYEAECGEVDSATARARELFSKVGELHLPAAPSHELLAYYRFQILELEALVAGLDYEAELKTYPERFLTLAECSGFRLMEHCRVYATSGYGEMDGGTHVFALRKEA